MDVVTYSRTGLPAPRQRRGARVDWVDTAKGVCIVFVVMMHATLGVGLETGQEGYMHWVVAFAKPFRMPDFFLISGLFLSRVIDRDWRSYADKRVLHFLYFYVLWLVIQSSFKYGQLSGGDPATFARHLLHALYEPFSTLWFVYLLAVFSIVTKIVRPVPAPVVLAAAVALQILPISTGSFLYDQFCARWIYFLAGYLFASRIFALADLARARRGLAALALAGWAIGNGVLALAPSGLAAFPHPADLPVIGLAAGLAGACAIVAVASLLTDTVAARPLRYCGQNSIAIYLAFFLPMALTRLALMKSGWITDVGTMSLVVTAVAVAVPLGLERMVRATPLAFLFRRPAWCRIPAAKPRPALSTAT